MSSLLEVDQLSVEFPGTEGQRVRAVSQVSFELGRGETVGLVGESGSGKSVTALSLLRLVPPPGEIVGGAIRLEGQNLLELDEDGMRELRGDRMAMIFQDPLTALNPVLSVERQLTEGLQVHRGMSRKQARVKAVELLDKVGIPAAGRRLFDYPHQFSGGMRQRVVIAMALATGPSLLLADEPTTALDVTIQAQILDLLRSLKREQGTAVLLISHDLGVIAAMAERVLVMYAGRIVEEGTAREVFHSSRMPYTWGLLGSLPRVDAEPGARLEAIPGQPPDLADLPAGCPFEPRCALARGICRQERPELTPRPDHPGLSSACHATAPGGWA